MEKMRLEAMHTASTVMITFHSVLAVTESCSMDVILIMTVFISVMRQLLRLDW